KCAVDFQLPVVGVENVFDDGQPEARTPLISRAALVHPVKALGDAGKVLRSDPDAFVPHRHPHVSIRKSLRTDLYQASRVAVLDAVIHEVNKYLSDALPITQHEGQTIRHTSRKRDLSVSRRELERLDGLSDQTVQAKRLHRHL